LPPTNSPRDAEYLNLMLKTSIFLKITVQVLKDVHLRMRRFLVISIFELPLTEVEGKASLALQTRKISAGILEQSIGARNRVGIGLSY
jgi:hypothetical protein